MTVSTTIIKNFHNGNASTTNFAYQFRILEDTDLLVIIRTNSTGAETTKTLSTHYTVAGAGDASGGSITFTAGNIPASGETVVIRRNVPQTQAIDYIANDPFPAETHEEGLDRGTMVAQQVAEESDRSIKLSRTNTMTSTEFTVGATDRANKILAFDSSGEISVTQELGTFKGSDATTTTAAYVQRDIIKSTTSAQLNNVYICVADSVVGDLLTDTDHFQLLVDAVSAATSATAASSSATAAASSATDAQTAQTAAELAETNAETAETNAETAETNAATSETNAANSATASANSASAAAATFDLFDDSYLGAKASNPSVDNDGNALQDGALYFDTTNDVMKVYNLANTTWYQLTPTVSNQNNINTLAAISSDVTQAASDSADIQTVSSDSADIRTLADIEDGTTATNAVSNAGNNATSIVTVAGQISPTNNISSVAAIAADITSVANIDTDVTAVANDATDIGTVATDLTGSDNIGTVATDIVNVNLVGGSIANVNTVATNIASVNNFGEVYRISATAPITSLNSGDLYFDTSTNILNVYGASGWQNAGSSVNGTSQRYNYTATNAQTTFTGADNNGNTLAYDAGYVDVYLNGVKLLNATDVTVTSGSSVVLASGATTGDVVDIVAYGTFSVASLNADNLDSGTVPDARITGAYTGITNLTMSGDLTVDTNTLFVDASENSVGIKNTAPKVTLDVRATSFTPDNTNTSLLVEAPAVFSQAQHFYINNAGAYNSSRPTGGIGAVNSSNVITLTAGSIVTDNPGADGFKAYSTDSSLYDIGNAEHTFSTKTGLTVGNQFTHTKRVKIFNNGVTAFNDGIALGVGINNTASNVLDDYEEGTWTPSFTNISPTYSTQTGTYTKIGNTVFCTAYISTSSFPNSSGSPVQINVPFVGASNPQFVLFDMAIPYNVNNLIPSSATAMENAGARVETATMYFKPWYSSGAGGSPLYNTFNSSGDIVFTFQYQTT